VAIADEKVGIQGSQVQRDLTHAMCTIDETEDSILFAHPGDSLKGEANTRQRDDRLKQANLGGQSVVQDSGNGLGEGIDDFGMRAGKRICKVLAVSDFSYLELWVGLDE